MFACKVVRSAACEEFAGCSPGLIRSLDWTMSTLCGLDVAGIPFLIMVISTIESKGSLKLIIDQARDKGPA